MQCLPPPWLHLVDVVAGATVRCPECQVWTLATVAVPAAPQQRRLPL